MAMFHLRAFKTAYGYRVTNGPIEVALDHDLNMIETNVTSKIIIDHAIAIAAHLMNKDTPS